MASNNRTAVLGFNPCIHGLRGFAALSVFVFHIYDMSRKLDVIPEDLWLPLKIAITSLSSGVDLFFMISGFLITGSLIRHANIAAFLKDRVIRIYPVFFFLHVALFTLAPFIGYKWMEGITPLAWTSAFFSNLFFLPGIFDLPLMQLNAWSLSYEFAFYLFSAAIYGLFQIKREAAWIALFAGLSVLFALYPRAVFFFVGSSVFFLLRSGKVRLPALGIFAVIPYFAIMGWFLAAEKYGYAALGAPFGFFIFWDVASGAPLFGHFLKTRFMLFFGTISYSFYLWHAVVTFPLKHIMAKILIARFGLPPALAIFLFGVTAFAASTLVSWLSYQWLEQKGGRFLRAKLKPAALEAA